MAITIDNAFSTMFSDQVTHNAQQKASKLQGAVRTVRNVTGSTYKFPILGKAGAVKNKVSHQDIEALSTFAGTPSPTGAATWVGDTGAPMNFGTSATATIDTYSAGEYADDFDILKTNADVRDAYATSIAAAMNRAYDNAIISALDASVSAQALAAELTNNTLNAAGLIAIHKALNDTDADENDRYLLVSPNGYSELITNFGNNADGPFNRAFTDGSIPNVMGFNVIMHTGLSAGSNSDHKSYAWSKSAVGMAVGKDITTSVNYVPQKLATLISSEFSGGAVVIDPKSVVSFEA